MHTGTGTTFQHLGTPARSIHTASFIILRALATYQSQVLVHYWKQQKPVGCEPGSAAALFAARSTQRGH